MSIRFFPAVTTRYRFIGISKSRCRLRYDTLNFTIHRSKLKAAFDIRPRVTDMASPTLYLFDRSQNAVTYDWFLNEASWSTSANPSYTATDTGFYCFTLVATDAFHCQDTATDCGEVLHPLIYVPSAFSPNGDDKNDIFRPISRHLEILEFSVYNRFGQRVFVTSNNRDGWDGTFNGKLCDVGTYFYQVRYRVLQREPGLLKGDVTLLR
jgi:gliding motility-associated-like protein